MKMCGVCYTGVCVVFHHFMTSRCVLSVQCNLPVENSSKGCHPYHKNIHVLMAFWDTITHQGIFHCLKITTNLFFSLFSDTSVDLPYDDKNVHVSFIPNPSHLEVRASLIACSLPCLHV